MPHPYDVTRCNVEAELTRPSGLIQFDRRLSDEEFDDLSARWRERWREQQSHQRSTVIVGSLAYWTGPDPSLPAWLYTPYAGRDRCWGCGLEPEVMNPGQWILCSWCDELRALLAARR